MAQDGVMKQYLHRYDNMVWRHTILVSLYLVNMETYWSAPIMEIGLIIGFQQTMERTGNLNNSFRLPGK